VDIQPLRLDRPVIDLLDQTELPHREVRLRLSSVMTVCEAIASLRVRGAPLLGLMGVAGLAVAASERGPHEDGLRAAARTIAETRPTAVDLARATYAALDAALAMPPPERERSLWEAAGAYLQRRVAEDTALADHGVPLMPVGGAVLTHCNTGVLATGGVGTALGVIRRAWEAGRVSHVYATETRPLLQGARLTAWELTRLGLPSSLLPDTAAAALIASGRVQAVITGADRVAANGDTANKVGTYGLAAVAARHGIPFFIAAPLSTIDLDCPDGAHIPIEFRTDDEVGGFAGVRWAPGGLGAFNPAFDVTPASLIAAVITERGVARAPYTTSLVALARP
jgi:methylthioribose-1-phosphate isomerase